VFIIAIQAINYPTGEHLIKIVNDTLLSIDSGSVVGLVGLDVTAAFDTVSHDRLVDRLKSEFGIDSAPLQWIESYLKSISFSVQLGWSLSSVTPLASNGVP